MAASRVPVFSLEPRVAFFNYQLKWLEFSRAKSRISNPSRSSTDFLNPMGCSTLVDFRPQEGKKGLKFQGSKEYTNMRIVFVFPYVARSQIAEVKVGSGEWWRHVRF